MPTLNEIVENHALILFGENATNLQKEILRNACLLYARSIVPEEKIVECCCGGHLDSSFSKCRTEILNKIDEAEKSL